MKRGHGMDECGLEQLFRLLAEETTPPSEDELRTHGRRQPSRGWRPARRLSPTARSDGSASDGASHSQPSPSSSGAASGFGLGSSATPSGSAGTTFRGLGFLPAPGWTVVQGAVADSGGVSSAVAIESLPKHAVLIHVTFTPRRPGRRRRARASSVAHACC